ncbi:uncharacterized protein METZ01_LOCUS428297 [marine metagenome]|uniref:Uncharacterized protein n=1 Tax=marine metagenome TaxID=408172 RepID=A0A382XWS6_9ZZZZ
MLVHRYAVLKVQPKSHNQAGRFIAAQPRPELPLEGNSGRAQRSSAAEQRTSRLQNYQASIRPKSRRIGWYLRTL